MYAYRIGTEVMYATPRRAVGLPALLSAAFAVVSFASGALVGLLAALAAVAVGVVGVLLTLAPAVGGRFFRAATLSLAGTGVVAALYRLIE